MLRGKAPSPDLFGNVADRILAGAKGYEDNAFKIDLAKATASDFEAWLSEAARLAA